MNHNRLKTNLKVAIQRLKLLEKKKTELALKATKEIAELIKQSNKGLFFLASQHYINLYLVDKYDRARIKVEHIIREYGQLTIF